MSFSTPGSFSTSKHGGLPGVFPFFCEIIHSVKDVLVRLITKQLSFRKLDISFRVVLIFTCFFIPNSATYSVGEIICIEGQYAAISTLCSEKCLGTVMFFLLFLSSH